MRVYTVSLMFLLAACDSNTAADTDEHVTNDTDTESEDNEEEVVDTNSYDALTNEELTVIYQMTKMPSVVSLLVSSMVAEGEELDCPTVTIDSGITTITGGCTSAGDEGNTYYGEASLVGTAFGYSATFTDFAISNGDNALIVNGEQVMYGDGTTTNNLRISVSGEYFGEGEAEVTNFSVTGDPKVVWGEDGYAHYSGRMVMDGVADLEISGGPANQSDGCWDEPHGGILIATGSHALEYAFDGLISCDGCFPVRQNGSVQTICPYDDDNTDTDT